MTSIALLHYSAPPVVGGVERVLARHAVHMADAGHAVRIVAGRGASPDERVAFVRLPLADPLDPEIRSIGRELEAGRVPGAFAAVVGRLRRTLEDSLRGSDLVIAHNVGSLHFNLALTIALRDAVEGRTVPRCILWHHDLAWTQDRFRASLYDREPWTALRVPWPGVQHVTISRRRRDELAALLGLPLRAIAVVPNGVDVASAPRLDPRTRALLAGTPILDRVPLLLLPARITPRKNIELALRAVAAIRELGRPGGLVVTGPLDPHHPLDHRYLAWLLDLRLELGLEGSAWFLAESDEAPGTEALVDDLYWVADALFLPSREEGFGLPILEAAVRRLPVICTDLPVFRDLLGAAATYVPPDGDPAMVAETILGRLDRDRSVRLARRVRAEFSWEVIYRRSIAPLLAGEPVAAPAELRPSRRASVAGPGAPGPSARATRGGQGAQDRPHGRLSAIGQPLRR